MTQANKLPWTVEELVPHAEPMILIDEVLDWSEDTLKSRVMISEDSVFYEKFQGVPVWVGVEYMAQTIAALAGVRAKRDDKPVRIGFLVGTRRYEAAVPMFTLGQVLEVSVSEIFQDGGMGVFNCEIRSNRTELLASASLNVYLPQNISD
ncbi:MAG: hotdog family protein [Sphingomonadales bacterium]|jgi:predicted hotdog family 3-hydroxylacyl-ACP dehydratase